MGIEVLEVIRETPNKRTRTQYEKYRGGILKRAKKSLSTTKEERRRKKNQEKEGPGRGKDREGREPGV